MATHQRPLEAIFIAQLAIQLEQYAPSSPPASRTPLPPRLLTSLLIPLRRLLQRLAPRLARAARLHRAVSTALAPLARERGIRRHLCELSLRMMAMDRLEETVRESVAADGWLAFYQCADRLLGLAQRARAESTVPCIYNAAAAATDDVVAVSVANDASASSAVDPPPDVAPESTMAAAAARAVVQQASELRWRGVYWASVASCLQRLLVLLGGEVGRGQQNLDCRQRQLRAAVRDYTTYGERVCGIHGQLLQLARQLRWEGSDNDISDNSQFVLLILPNTAGSSLEGKSSNKGHLITANSSASHSRQETLSTETFSVIQDALAGNKRLVQGSTFDYRYFNGEERSEEKIEAGSRDDRRLQALVQEPTTAGKHQTDRATIDPLTEAEVSRQNPPNTLTRLSTYQPSEQQDYRPKRLIRVSTRGGRRSLLTSTTLALPALLLTQNHQHQRRPRKPLPSPQENGRGGGGIDGSIRHRWAQEGFESFESGGASLLMPLYDASSSAALAAAIEVPEPPPSDGSEVGGDKAALIATVMTVQRACMQTVAESQPDLASTHTTTETCSDSPEAKPAAAVTAEAARRLRRARQSSATEASEKKAKMTGEKGLQEDRTRRKPEKLLLVQLESRDHPPPRRPSADKKAASSQLQQKRQTAEKHKQITGVKSKSKAVNWEVSEPVLAPKSSASTKRRKTRPKEVEDENAASAVAAAASKATVRPDTASNSDGRRRQRPAARRTVVEILKPEIAAPRSLHRR